MSKAYQCKVCFDAGKPSAIYNSHYVRDQPGGKVVCPTILNQNCSYCKEQGHSPRCCPKLAGKYSNNKYNKAKPDAKQEQDPKAKQEKEFTKKDSLRDSQKRARELCRSPPPPPPESKKGEIIRPTPCKVVLNGWAALVAKEATPIQQNPMTVAEKHAAAKTETAKLTKACISDVINKGNTSQKIIQNQLKIYKEEAQAQQQQANEVEQQQQQQEQQQQAQQQADEFFRKEKELYMQAQQAQAQQAQAQQAQAQQAQAQQAQAQQAQAEQQQEQPYVPKKLTWADEYY
jgi:hypothetical protein